MSERRRRAKPPEETGPARAGPSRAGATSTAPDQGGAAIPQRPPPLMPTADEWLPPLAFLPPERPPPKTLGWSPWTSSQGTPYRPRHSDPQMTLDNLASQAADWVYDSKDDLAVAFHAHLATLADMPELVAVPSQVQASLSGFLTTAQGPRYITVLLDTGATHCFICARLAAALGLPP
jgi:hypothetical protein